MANAGQTCSAPRAPGWGHQETGTGLCPVPAPAHGQPCLWGHLFFSGRWQDRGTQCSLGLAQCQGLHTYEGNSFVHKLQWEKIECCLFSITLILAPFSWDGRNLPHQDPHGTCLRSPEWWLTACPRPGPTWASRGAWALQLPMCCSSGRDSQPSTSQLLL